LTGYLSTPFLLTFAVRRERLGMVQTNTTTGSRFFRGVGATHVAAIMKAGRKLRVTAGTVIVDEGSPADDFYLLVTGSARLFSLTDDGRKVFLFSVRPGDIFGANALLSEPAVYLASTEALEDSTVYVWPGKVIRSLAAQRPGILENCMSIASDYLAWYSATHLSLIRDRARTRLVQVVSTLAKDIGTRTAQGIALKVSNEELANAANVTPFTASRIISSWQKRGAVVKGRGTLLLRSKALLN
jgi:CRP-like cAMP-binding protein